MKMFNMINIGERAGSSVPDIYAVWKNVRWQTTIVEELYNPDRTIFTLLFEEKKARDIIQALVDNGKVDTMGVTKGKKYFLSKKKK